MNQYAQTIRISTMTFAAVMLAIFLVSSAHAQDATPLEPGKPITRTAKRQQVDTYPLTLTAGQFIRVLVEQNEVDVSVELVAPDNKLAHIVNASRSFGSDSLSWEAATSGAYKIMIRTLFTHRSEGSYQIQLTVKDVATAQDKQRIAAERLMTEIFRTGTPSLPEPQRQEKYQQALRIWRELGDRPMEAQTHEVMGYAYNAERKFEQAREALKQALSMRQELQDHLGRIVTISNIGGYARVERNTSPNRNSERSQQLIKQDEEYHLQALELSRKINHRGAERFILTSLTGTYNSQNLREKPISLLEQILIIDRENKNRTDEANTLRFLSDASSGVRRDEDALRYAEQSLVIFRELKYRTGEASALSSIGSAYQATKRPDIALQNYEAALVILRELKERRAEAFLLRSIAAAHTLSDRYDLAIQSSELALSIFRELKDRQREAETLLSIGGYYSWADRDKPILPYYEKALAIYRELKNHASATATLNQFFVVSARLGRLETAQRFFEEYLTVFRDTKDRKGEADAIFQYGNIHSMYGSYATALHNYETALPIYRELKDRTNEGAIYKNIGLVYGYTGRYELALENIEKAIAIWREIKNDIRLAHETYNLGVTYIRLNRIDKAIEQMEEVLTLGRSNKRPYTQAMALDGFGNAYYYQGEYVKAIKSYEEAITLYREAKVMNAERESLWGIGLAYYKLGQPEKAIGYYEQSLAMIRRTMDRANESWLLNDYAEALRTLGRTSQAVEYDLGALRLAREIKARDAEAMALNGLRQDWSLQNQPQLATFFGKQAVNLYQDIRSGIRLLDKETQQSFLKSKEPTYRELADLLISQGRLPEAEQVIRMLKEEEYFEYVRRDIDNSSKGERAALTPEEAAIEKRYREIGDRLSEIGSQRSDLLGKPVRTTEEEQLLAKLEADLTVANQMFQKFLDGLAVEMAKQKDGGANITKLRDAQGLMEDLRELGKGVVALYTLVGENKYRVILTTADFQRAYEYPIKAADLNRKILAFRTALQNPKLDPLPLAQELYKILVAPVAKDLRGAKAQMLMWSLDGVLRYVPVAALHDGEKFLVERFRNAVFTPASNARFKDEPSRNWKVLGLGVTKSFGPNIPALPGVAEEMRGIINDGTSGNGGKGVLPGTIKLDEQFTQESMLTGLRQRNPVVHVASHFQFKPGNETDSALLLGDGKFLSLAQIKALPQVFSGVELLTLSACDTATSSSGANGKEVEGFGALAQKQGAKAVIASLWPVADRSTKNLMQEFYRLRETKGNVTKSEAMRQAQIKLLRGELQVTGEVLAAREIAHEADKTANLPPYKVDPKAPYAHPYYWAPFILIGNWK